MQAHTWHNLAPPTQACKATAVEALHAAATAPFHGRNILNFRDIAKGFHDLVVGLKGNVGPQFTAGATLMQLCIAEIASKHTEPDIIPAVIAALGTNCNLVLSIGTFPLIVSAIKEAIQVMHC